MTHRKIDDDAKKLLSLLKTLRESAGGQETVNVKRSDLTTAIDLATNTLWNFESLRLEYPYGPDGTHPYGPDGSSPESPVR